MFAAFSADHLMEPFFFKENGSPVTVNGDRYREVITNHIVPQMKRHRCFSKAIFQQDGAPPHTAAETRNLLTKTFGEDRVIGKFFPFPWPAYSPDLSPCDFWLSNEIKTSVYQHQLPQNLDDLERKIGNAFSVIDTDLLESVVFNSVKRMHLCIENNGGHLEHVYNR